MDRTESPAHKHEYHALLKKRPISDAIDTSFNKIRHDRTVGEAIQILKDSKPDSIAIVDADGKYVGFADSDGLMKLSSPDVLLSEIIPSIVAAPGVSAEDSLYDAIKKISDSKIMELPVISEENVVVGTVSMSGIMEAYDQKLADSDDVRD